MRESDLVGRFGGEEMAVVLSGTDAEEACMAAERARTAIQDAALTYEGQRLHVTVSVGAAQCRLDETAEGVIKRADHALYAAKQAGRNRAFWNNGVRSLCIGGADDGCQPEPEPATVLEEAAESVPGRTTESFAEICQDLRRRLEEVTVG
jgi:hypothetical protein